MNIAREFSRFANLYDRYNTIQLEVAKRLVSKLNLKHYDNILDIGCGSGAIYNELVSTGVNFNKFIAVDFSEAMLDIHPSSKKIDKFHFNFNNQEDFNQLSKYDLVISSSALQWSEDLDMTLREIGKLSNYFYFAIFTSNTFSQLHKLAQTSSPIYSKDTLKNSIENYFKASFETVEYKLEFSNVYEMLRYIKRSGVSGGRGELGYRDIKHIIKNYPLNYLEFEVLFVEATLK